MHKIICFFGVLLTLFVNISHSKDLVLALRTDGATQKSIYHHYVARTGLHKTRPDNYHVTVGWIKNIHGRDYQALKTFMERKLAFYKKNPVFFQPSHAYYYLVGGRSPQHCPIVLYPEAKSVARLKRINALLLKDLRSFKAPSKKKYTFHQDVMPASYKPHITLADSQHISSHGVQKKQTLGMINKKVKARKKATIKLR